MKKTTVSNYMFGSKGKCLANINISAGDSRDELGRYRFLPLPPEAHLIPKNMRAVSWWSEYAQYPQKMVPHCSNVNKLLATNYAFI